MTDLERVLREGLHDRLDDLGADALGDVGRGVPQRAARIRRRQAAVVSAAAAAVLLAGVGATFALSGGRGSDRVGLVDDGPSASAPARPGLAGRVEAYAAQFAAGDFESITRDMTPAARAQLTPSRLRQVWWATVGRTSLVRVGDATESVTGHRPTAFVDVASSTGRGDLYVVYDGADVSAVLLVSTDTTDPRRDDDVVRRSQEIVRQLSARDFRGVRRDFDETMLAGLSEARLAATWDQVHRVYGDVESANGVLVALAPSGHRVVDVVTRFSDGVMKVRVSFDSRKRIAGLFVLVLDA